MADRHQDSAEDQRLVPAEPFVGDDPAGDRGQ